MEYTFQGKWISNEKLADLQPRNVFFRQLEVQSLDCSQYRNEHILFRRKFSVDKFSSAKIYITADDYYKLYINGKFVAQGPAPSYHFRYNYNEVDIGKYLQTGENVIAVHTLYQGLINRVWQSGDFRHGLLCDIVVDGKTVVCSDESFKVATHTAYTETGTCGYATQFLETYDSQAEEVGFERPDFDDGAWAQATERAFVDYGLQKQTSHGLVFEDILPVAVQKSGNRVLYDFGANYVGYFRATTKGQAGDCIVVRCAQELNDDGSLRFSLRANCVYEEKWILSGGEDTLDWFDYKAFRYVELEFPSTVYKTNACLLARHYPFAQKVNLKMEYETDEDLRAIWSLCVHSQRYGVQEVIQDCMEREKGFYLGDGCYTAFANMLLTGDDSMVKKLIDDAFATSFITPTLMTCMDCSFMQEIAEYPLIMVMLILWHYRYTGDRTYLMQNYQKTVRLLEAYRKEYETDGLLKNVNKWCVVEWPKNFQDGYGVDIREGQVCVEAHVALNAYYIYAVRIANLVAGILGEEPYRDTSPLQEAFYTAFYDKEDGLFRDGESTEHKSLVGNALAYGLNLCPTESSKNAVLAMLDGRGIDALSFFCTFPVLMRFAKEGDKDRLKNALLNDGAWKRMLREGATTTFEGWGKETKWNTSLFHLTMSYAVVFMAEIDLKKLFD